MKWSTNYPIKNRLRLTKLWAVRKRIKHFIYICSISSIVIQTITAVSIVPNYSVQMRPKAKFLMTSGAAESKPTTSSIPGSLKRIIDIYCCKSDDSLRPNSFERLKSCSTKFMTEREIADCRTTQSKGYKRFYCENIIFITKHYLSTVCRTHF